MSGTNEVQTLPEEGKAVIASQRGFAGRDLDARAVLEISSKKSESAEIIKSSAVIESSKGGAKTAARYIGAPRYRIVMGAENFKVAEKSMNHAVERILIAPEKHHGAYKDRSEKSEMICQSGQVR